MDNIIVQIAVSVICHKNHHVHDDLEKARGVGIMLKVVDIDIGLTLVTWVYYVLI